MRPSTHAMFLRRRRSPDPCADESKHSPPLQPGPFTCDSGGSDTWTGDTELVQRSSSGKWGPGTEGGASAGAAARAPGRGADCVGVTEGARCSLHGLRTSLSKWREHTWVSGQLCCSRGPGDGPPRRGSLWPLFQQLLQVGNVIHVGCRGRRKHHTAQPGPCDTVEIKCGNGGHSTVARRQARATFGEGGTMVIRRDSRGLPVQTILCFWLPEK